MIFLVGSILSSSLIFLIFKLFEQRGIDNFSAIVINYGTAALIGLALFGLPTSFDMWWTYAVALGFLFIFLFNVMALVSQRNGPSIAVIANKSSLLVPLTLAVVMLGEQMDNLTLAGIALALMGMIMALFKSEDGFAKGLLLPFVLFFGSGILDWSLKYVQSAQVPNDEFAQFSSVVFGVAFLLGLIAMPFRKTKPAARDIQWGVLLGVPNFFSIYLLLETLEVYDSASSFVFPFNNFSIVILTSVVSYFMFKESLSPRNKFGIFLAACGIFLMGYASG